MDGRRPKRFSRLATRTSRAVGRPSAFLAALLSIGIWAGAGPFFRFSDTWQLVVNTGTTIATFLMVFLIQNAQNRDSEAIQVKLDALILATKEAYDGLLDAEELEQDELDRIRARFESLAKAARGPDAAASPRVPGSEISPST